MRTHADAAIASGGANVLRFEGDVHAFSEPLAQGEVLDRFAWRLIYRDGRRFDRYSIRGETILRTRFGRLPTAGVAKIEVQDIEAMRPLLTIEVPEGSIVRIWSTNRLYEDGVARRIFCFGHHTGDETRGSYAHFEADPSGDVYFTTTSDGIPPER